MSNPKVLAMVMAGGTPATAPSAARGLRPQQQPADFPVAWLACSCEPDPWRDFASATDPAS